MLHWTKWSTKGTLPSKRCRHAGVYDPERDVLWIFGGNDGYFLDDMFKFSFTDAKWTKMNPLGNIPSRRYDHTLCFYENSLYLFGGFQHKFQYCDDLYSYNILTNTWTKITASGELPSKRSNHSCVVYQHSMFIFGGFDGLYHYNRLYEFQFKMNKWRIVNASGDYPSKRSKHVATIYKDCMLVFGGQGYRAATNRDLFKFHFPTNMWSEISVNGIAPNRIVLYSCSTLNDKMLIFGGELENKSYTNNLYEYDFQTEWWRMVQSHGDLPDPMSGHCSIVRNNSMIIFGGYDKNYKNGLFECKVTVPNNISALVKLLDEKEQSRLVDIHMEVGSIVFKAHQCIIAQSEVLNNLIHSIKSHQKMIHQNGTPLLHLKINNTKPIIFEKVLRFMYTGSIDVQDVSLLPDLIESSKIFKLKSLEQKCEKIFASMLNNENIFSIFNSIQHIDSLKQICLIYMKEHGETLQNMKQHKEYWNLIPMGAIQTKTHFKKDEISILYDYICKLFKSKQYADVTFITIDRKRILAHKALLCCFSEYFQLMFDNMWNESKAFEVEVPVKAEVLELILEYMYTCTITFPQNSIILFELMIACDSFLLKDLKELTEKKLLKQICASDALEIIHLCMKNNIEGKVLQKCWSIIKKVGKDELVDIMLETQVKQNIIMMEMQSQIDRLREENAKQALLLEKFSQQLIEMKKKLK